MKKEKKKNYKKVIALNEKQSTHFMYIQYTHKSKKASSEMCHSLFGGNIGLVPSENFYGQFPCIFDL